jgi:hypothetical protein
VRRAWGEGEWVEWVVVVDKVEENNGKQDPWIVDEAIRPLIGGWWLVAGGWWLS